MYSYSTQRSAAIPYVIRSTIGYQSNSCVVVKYSIS